MLLNGCSDRDRDYTLHLQILSQLHGMATAYSEAAPSSSSGTKLLRGVAGNANANPNATANSSFRYPAAPAKAASAFHVWDDAQAHPPWHKNGTNTGIYNAEPIQDMLSSTELEFTEDQNHLNQRPEGYVQALYTYPGEELNHLSFIKGDIVEVLGREDTGWWDGILVRSQTAELGKRGWFPSSQYRILCALVAMLTRIVCRLCKAYQRRSRLRSSQSYE